MKKIFISLCLVMLGCGADHEKERIAVCQHSEGYTDSDCNAGDDFTPETCISAMDALESWWRGDAQTSINNCMISSACYAKSDGVPGPSILIPLQACMQTELLSSLKPTDAEDNAAARYCVKAIACNEITFSILGCKETLLSPYDDGQLFLMMNDETANAIAACDVSSCADFDTCVANVFHQAGAFSTINGLGVKKPSMLKLN